MRVFLLICLIINIELKEIKKEKSPVLLYKQILDKNTINNNKNFLLNLTDYLNQTPFNKTNNSEIIFRDHIRISIFLLFCGIFIMLYGAYYYKLSLLFHYIFFLYYFCVIILPNINTLLYQYVFLFSFVSGILIYALISTDDITSMKYKIQKILYGIILGCFIHKIITYYINFFFKDNNFSIRINVLYYISFFLFILLFGVINNFMPDYLTFLPCSIISSSFYVIKFLDCALHQKNQKYEKEAFLTNFIIQFIIIIWSTIFQIYHINYKISESPNVDQNEKIIKEISRISSCRSSTFNNINIKSGTPSNEQTINNTLKVNELDNEDEDEEVEINEHED